VTADLVLDHSDADLLDRLLKVWEKKRPRNLERTVYYDGKAALKDFGISLPPQMRNVGAALGWVAKGVHGVTDRSQFEGFVDSSGSDDPFGIAQIAYENQFELEFPAAEVSSAVHGCSFLTITAGDVASGEPSELVIPVPADRCAAIWDTRRRRLAGFLSIIDVTSYGRINLMVLYTPEKAVRLTRRGGAWNQGWIAEVIRNPLGRVTAVPLPYKYELNRPLGHSRITRAAMSSVDSAIRTIVRAEVSSEFYAADSYWLFGADVTKFVGDDKWSALMGRIKALDVDPDETDKYPEIQRFTGASPQPHTDQLRMWANLFADDQDLEVKFADSTNPSSADAIFAAKETLITTTRDANKGWGHGAAQAMQMAVMLRDGLTEIPNEMRSLRSQFTDPAIVSPSARADAFSKLATNIDGFGSSEVGMEYAGLTREQITRFQAEQRRKGASDRIGALVAAVQGVRDGNVAAGDGVPAGEPAAGAPSAA